MAEQYRLQKSIDGNLRLDVKMVRVICKICGLRWDTSTHKECPSCKKPKAKAKG